jgi:hypothetical protein
MMAMIQHGCRWLDSGFALMEMAVFGPSNTFENLVELG